MGFSREITSGTKMDGYISSRRNSSCLWEGEEGDELDCQYKVVIATTAELAKKITSLTEKKTS